MLFDNYRFISPLCPKNRLNHTQIWQAMQLTTHQNVVIKQLLPDFTPLQYQHFYQEYQVYQTLNKLKYPQSGYFFHLLDASLTDKDTGLIFKYYHGKTLQQAHLAMSMSQKIACLIEVCHAVDILHAQGIIHCDIKPSNIFMTQEQVKLFDFGLAKKINPTAPHTACHHVAQSTAGTPAYMSPEQFTGGVLSPQTDYYSLGIVIYECLLGQKPFMADSIQNWAIAHCQTPVPTITDFTMPINLTLQALFHQLLAKLPHNRPQHLTPVIDLLKKL